MVIDDFGEENARLLAQAIQSSLNLFKEHVETLRIDCGYSQKDGYVYAQTDEQIDQLNKIVEATQKVGVPVSWTNQIPVPVEFKKAALFPGQAQIHPTRYVLALASEFEKLGGIIAEQCAVEKFDNNDGVLSFETTKGIVKAKQLVYATHIPPGINLLHFRCAPYRSYAMAVTLNDQSYPGALAYDLYDPYHYYRTQEIDGEKFLIVGGEDHKTAHQVNTEACFNQLESHVRKYFSVKDIAYKWSSQYFEPSDGLAYIGHLPGNPDNVFVASGYSGNGITYSHIAAITLRDLLTTGDSVYAKLFAPGRVKPVAGFTAFVKENADVVAQFFGKRFKQSDLESLAGLAPGEGKVVKYEGESLALYKDEKGGLHAVNPVCTHAKCVVDWNSAEKSWDCPCHGARYSVDGEVLTGPARKGLEVIAISDLIDKD
jgi:glycine/D-amino acid oxidase-like deaminating enzyme/nitrite reductase/ring-hydroxylating ferredoxin subunit